MHTSESRLWGNQLASALEGVVVSPRELDKGGHGSGHAGHAGRPGEVGGSEPGGVLIGRADAPDADDQFKFSGKARLDRPKGPHVDVEIGGRTRGRLEVHGMSEKGKTVKNKAVLRVGGSSIEVDHDELHAIRSKMRWVHTSTEKNVTEVSGKKIVRGGSVSVRIGERHVSIPVNAQSVASIDRAVHATKAKGYSLTAERHQDVAKAVHLMRTTNPVRVLKDKGFSKAGNFAAFHTHVEQHKDPDLRRMARAKQVGKGPRGKAAVESALKSLTEARAQARSSYAKLSGTQAVRHYKQAAILTTILGRK